MIINIQSVAVMYHGRKVGTLSMGSRSVCLFEYDKSFLTQSAEAVEQQFRRMAFNVYAKNHDDHARNFSFICREGKWKLAPAYDLTNDDTLGEHASTINYKGTPTDEDLIAVGTSIRMTRLRCQEIIGEVKSCYCRQKP